MVPSCQNLYKNSFTYFVPTSVPADFVSCFEFLGEAGTQTLLCTQRLPIIPALLWIWLACLPTALLQQLLLKVVNG